jgi:hypothetical protein
LTAAMPRRSIHDPRVQYAIARRMEKRERQNNRGKVLSALREHGAATLGQLIALTGLSCGECAAALDVLRCNVLVEPVRDGVWGIVCRMSKPRLV